MKDEEKGKGRRTRKENLGLDCRTPHFYLCSKSSQSFQSQRTFPRPVKKEKKKERRKKKERKRKEK